MRKTSLQQQARERWGLTDRKTLPVFTSRNSNHQLMEFVYAYLERSYTNFFKCFSDFKPGDSRSLELWFKIFGNQDAVDYILKWVLDEDNWPKERQIFQDQIRIYRDMQVEDVKHIALKARVASYGRHAWYLLLDMTWEEYQVVLSGDEEAWKSMQKRYELYCDGENDITPELEVTEGGVAACDVREMPFRVLKFLRRFKPDTTFYEVQRWETDDIEAWERILLNPTLYWEMRSDLEKANKDGYIVDSSIYKQMEQQVDVIDYFNHKSSMIGVPFKKLPSISEVVFWTRAECDLHLDRLKTKHSLVKISAACIRDVEKENRRDVPSFVFSVLMGQKSELLEQVSMGGDRFNKFSYTKWVNALEDKDWCRNVVAVLREEGVSEDVIKVFDEQAIIWELFVCNENPSLRARVVPYDVGHVIAIVLSWDLGEYIRACHGDEVVLQQFDVGLERELEEPGFVVPAIDNEVPDLSDEDFEDRKDVYKIILKLLKGYRGYLFVEGGDFEYVGLGEDDYIEDWVKICGATDGPQIVIRELVELMHLGFDIPDSVLGVIRDQAYIVCNYQKAVKEGGLPELMFRAKQVRKDLMFGWTVDEFNAAMAGDERLIDSVVEMD